MAKIEQRISLLQAGHSKLVLDGETILIHSLIGTGASCLAYDADRIEMVKKMDGSETAIRHRVVLKEFYPVERTCGMQLMRLSSGELQRNSETGDDTQFRFCQERFLVSYYRSADLGGKEKTASFVSIPFKCVAANGTYYLMYAYDPGRTAAAIFGADHHSEYSLYDLFSLLYHTAESVARLHDYDEEMQAQGSLHLDLSPANILLTGEGRVKLFDMDSFIPVSEVRDRQYQISCPDGYMAPEQITLRRTRIGPWTDVFALGAIAYRYLMQRKLDYVWLDAAGNYQLDGSRARALLEQFEYEEELEVNAKNLCNYFPDEGMKLLKKFLRKTLAYHDKKRYRNMKDVQVVLKQLMNFALQKEVSILPCFHKNQMPVYGQDGVMKELETVFQTCHSHTPVFISGIGGIGKSTLAKAFAQKYFDEYQVVAEVHADCVEQILMQIYLSDETQTEQNQYLIDSERYLRQKAEKIRTICDTKKVLFIIHDYDQRNLKNFDFLIKLKADILITSRCIWSDLGYPQVRLCEDVLSPKYDAYAAQNLFFCYYKAKLSEEEKKDLNLLLSYIEYHPLTIELLAKQMAFLEGEEIRPKQMLAELKWDGISRQEQIILYGKDGYDYTENSVQGHLSKIFATALDKNILQKEEIEALRIMLLFGSNKVTRQQFVKWSKHEDSDAVILERLKRQGWICKHQDTYYMLYAVAECLSRHPLTASDLSNSMDFVNVFYEEKLEQYTDFNQREFLIHISQALWKRMCIPSVYDEFYCDFLERIASVLADGGLLDEAFEVVSLLPEKAESEYSRIRGLMHCGSLSYEKKEYENALFYYQNAEQILHKQVAFEDKEQLAVFYDWFGKIHQKLNKKQDSEQYFQQEKQIWTEMLEEIEESDSARLYDELGRCCIFLNETEQALRYYKKAIIMRENNCSSKNRFSFPEFDPVNPLAARDEILSFGRKLQASFLEDEYEEPDRLIAEYHMISCLEWKLGNRKRALECAEKCVELQKEYLGESHLYVASSYRWISHIYEDSGERKNALTYESLAFEILERVLGEEHEETKDCETCLKKMQSEHLQAFGRKCKNLVSTVTKRCQIPLYIWMPILCFMLFRCGVWYTSLISRQDIETIWWEVELIPITRSVTINLIGLFVMILASFPSQKYWEKWIFNWQLIAVVMAAFLFRWDMAYSSLFMLFIYQAYRKICNESKKRILGVIAEILLFAFGVLVTRWIAGTAEAVVVIAVQVILEIIDYNDDLLSWIGKLGKAATALMITVFVFSLICRGANPVRILFMAAMYGWLLYGIGRQAERITIAGGKYLSCMVLAYVLCELLAAAVMYDFSALPFAGVSGENGIVLWFLIGIVCSCSKEMKQGNQFDLLNEMERIEKQREEMYRYIKGL